MGDGIGRTLRRATSLLVLLPLATVGVSRLLDLATPADGPAGYLWTALLWIVPVMSGCAVATAAIVPGVSPARRLLAWIAGTAAGSALSLAMLWTPLGATAGVILAGLQLWQVFGVGAAIATVRIVAELPRPPLGRAALLILLLPVMTLVTLVFVTIVHREGRPTLGADFPVWILTVVSAAAATTSILAERASFPERVGAWIAATIAAAAVTVALHAPVAGLFAAAASGAGPLDPAAIAVELWQALGPALAILLATLSLQAWGSPPERFPTVR